MTYEIIQNGSPDQLILPLAFIAGYGLGAWIDPDLDLGTLTEAEKRWQKIPFHFLFKIWWRLYAAIISKLGGHRSFMSHFPAVSSGIRLGWLLLPFAPVVLYTHLWTVQVPWTLVILGCLAGLTLADTIHWLADVFN